MSRSGLGNSNRTAFAPTTTLKKQRAYEVYDIETTTNLQNVYLVGWYNGTVYRFWESVPLPPDNPASAMSLFASWLFSRKTSKPIYAHNGGNFDHLFLLRWLLKHIPTAKIEIVPVQSSILLMTVRIGRRKYEFRDSMRLMVGGLDSIAKALLGIGKVEGIDYSTLHEDDRRYEYLKRDCVVLFDSIAKFSEVVETKLRGNIGLTIASTAIETLKHGYLSHSIKSLKPDVEAFVRQAYYGGRTEVFKKYGDFPVASRRLKCFDVNSLYPWAMTKEMPTEYVGESTSLVSGEMGFFDCTVNTRECSPLALKYPVLPYRYKGKLIFPLGRFRGVWASCELHTAMSIGYTIEKVHHGYSFHGSLVFREYMEKLFSLRDKSLPEYDETISRIAKLLSNSTYGKFGTNREREKVHINPSLDSVIDNQMRPIQGPIELPVFIETVNCDASYILPHLAAWITARARLRLLQLIYKCLSPVYYCDTDSIYSCHCLPTGTGLGELKEEHSDIIHCRFTAPKVYELVHANGERTVKAKGFSQFAKGFVGAYADLEKGIPIECSAMSKFRTILRGDFGLIMRNKRLLSNTMEKRVFSKDGTSVPITIEEG